jgi:hypothetical protein
LSAGRSLFFPGFSQISAIESRAAFHCGGIRCGLIVTALNKGHSARHRMVGNWIGVVATTLIFA